MGFKLFDALYAQHIDALKSRTDRALEATGFDALVVHSGQATVQFLDDQDYPYKVNPHFKYWAPILDNPRCYLVHAPGARPKLLFYKADDYWHQAAVLPSVGSPSSGPLRCSTVSIRRRSTQPIY